MFTSKTVPYLLANGLNWYVPARITALFTPIKGKTSGNNGTSCSITKGSPQSLNGAYDKNLNVAVAVFPTSPVIVTAVLTPPPIIAAFCLHKPKPLSHPVLFLAIVKVSLILIFFNFNFSCYFV
jgi:hypothetical protein